jgi:hypothetical protein
VRPNRRLAPKRLLQIVLGFAPQLFSGTDLAQRHQDARPVTMTGAPPFEPIQTVAHREPVKPTVQGDHRIVHTGIERLLDDATRFVLGTAIGKRTGELDSHSATRPLIGA